MLYRIIFKEITPTPKQQYLKHSRIAVIGFNAKIILIFPVTSERGYTTGIAYINMDRKNSKAFAKSRYLVVIEEIINPNPVAIKTIHRRMKGNINNLRDKNCL